MEVIICSVYITHSHWKSFHLRSANSWLLSVCFCIFYMCFQEMNSIHASYLISVIILFIFI